MHANNVNLISCGGQAAVPLLHALTRRYMPDYIEVVTTAASASVGRATRLNLDEYIATTQDAVRTLTGVHDVKVVVNLEPSLASGDIQGGDVRGGFRDSHRACVRACR